MCEGKLPSLKTDTVALFDLYHNNVNVDTTGIRKTFGVSSSTALKVIHKGMEYMAEKGITPYTYRLEIPVTILFEMYGWDIRHITKCAKMLKSN